QNHSQSYSRSIGPQRNLVSESQKHYALKIRRRGMPPLRAGRPCLVNRASSDLMGGRVRDLKGLHFGSAFNHLRQSLQDLGIRLAAISLSVVFFIPKTDGDCFITLRRNKTDLILKPFLSSEQRNDLPLKNA